MLEVWNARVKVLDKDFAAILLEAWLRSRKLHDLRIMAFVQSINLLVNTLDLFADVGFLSTVKSNYSKLRFDAGHEKN